MIAKAFQNTLVKGSLNLISKQNFSRKARETISELNKINEFDQQVKDKYLNKQYIEENFKNMDINEVKQRISEDYELQHEKIFSEESVLNEIKNDMFGNQEMRDQKQKLNDLQQQSRELQPMEKYFDNLSHEEFLTKAREFQKDIEFHRLADPEQRTNSISRDYANYSSYEQNTAELKDMRHEWEEYPDQVYQGKRILKFIENLDNDIKEKKELETVMNDLRLTNPDFNDAEIKKAHWENQTDKILKEQNMKHKFDLGENDLESDVLKFRNSTRLSPLAKEEIFKLYIKGWNIRDLSSRFGIVPERVKAIIWLRQKFYFEVLPNVDLQCLKAGMELEQQYNKEFPYMDYGIDLEELSRRNRGILTPSFKKQKDVDTRALKFTEQKKQYELDKFERKQVKKAFVTKQFIGQGEKGYFVKDWVINKGRGSDKVTKMFRQCIHQSHEPERLPKKVQRKLSQGPRIASQGFGHK